MPSLLQLWTVFLKRWNLLSLQNPFFLRVCLGLYFRVFFFQILELGSMCLEPRLMMSQQDDDEYFDIGLG